MPSGSDRAVKGLKEAGMETAFDKPGHFNYIIPKLIGSGFSVSR